jgi:hypothetical protein
MTGEDAATNGMPDISSWDAVDPARYPFDPCEALAVVQVVAPTVPGPVDPGIRLSPAELTAAREEESRWYRRVSLALADKYGNWAYGWSWSPGSAAYRWGVTRRYDFSEPIRISADDTLRLVVDELVLWRHCLEAVAEQFDRLLPRVRPGGTISRADTADWEAAITHLLLTAAGMGEDSDAWLGWSNRVLVWFLTAAGVPEKRSVDLVDAVLKDYYYQPLSAADVADVAEHIARQVCAPATGNLARAGDATDDWPDTWPLDWPSWRATNLARDHG